MIDRICYTSVSFIDNLPQTVRAFAPFYYIQKHPREKMMLLKSLMLMFVGLTGVLALSACVPHLSEERCRSI
jgi:hypothetical protein